MSEGKIVFSDEMMRQLVSKAILDGISTEDRTSIITAAVQSLFTVPDRGQYRYGDKRTRIQEAFDDACGHVARVIATEELQKPERRVQIQQLVADAVDVAMNDNMARSLIVTKMAGALADALSKIRE